MEEIDPIKYCEENFPESTEEFKKVQGEQYALFCEKQMDYGPSNISMGTDLKSDEDRLLSTKGIVVRMNDKAQRLVHLILRKGRAPKNESVLDTFYDTAVYCTIATLVSRGIWGR